MTQTFYNTIDELKDKKHTWVFISDKSGVLGTESARTARSVYGRTLNNVEGLEETGKGSSYGLIMREENRFTLVPYEELRKNMFALYGAALADPDRAYVLPDFLHNVLHRQQEDIRFIVNEIFIRCTDKSKFIFPLTWKKAFKL